MKLAALQVWLRSTPKFARNTPLQVLHSISMVSLGNGPNLKSHLYPVIGEQRLTYEELNMHLVQVEALLNSQPLYAQRSVPNDIYGRIHAILVAILEFDSSYISPPNTLTLSHIKTY